MRVFLEYHLICMDMSPLIISLKTAACSMVLTFFLGLLAAYGVVALPSRRLKLLADCVFTLPLVLPPTVAGFFLLCLFGVNGPVGAALLEWFAVKIAFSWGATVLAAVVISFPLMYRAARGALEQVDVQLIHAARLLGMREWAVFFSVRLPCALPGIAAGTVLAAARALGEFGATAMIAGNIAGRTRTLPLAIYAETAAGDIGAAGRYVLVIVLVSFMVVALLNFFSTRKDWP
ncbi:MAG: molybdate ABC transporter permease subunit [Spirochaetaceae bacterium]|jgi:molybdate transport system permease protein|nr:molybdate ABC transporter permease subunit [Spirochaetaceae bacterium]